MADGTFDVFWALESACYQRDCNALAREAHRLLGPGGRLVVADGFACHEAHEPRDARVMRQWMDGWAVPALPTLAGFERALVRAGFRDVRYLDCSANIEPSSRRLYWHSLYGLPIGWVAERLGLRTRVQTGNIVGARAQRTVVRRGLLSYGVFTATKAGAPAQRRSP